MSRKLINNGIKLTEWLYCSSCEYKEHWYKKLVKIVLGMFYNYVKWLINHNTTDTFAYKLCNDATNSFIDA